MVPTFGRRPPLIDISRYRSQGDKLLSDLPRTAITQQVVTRLLASTLLALFVGQNAQAQGPLEFVDEALSDLVRRAEFIIEGRVIKIDYRLSNQQSAEDEVLPNTFVTYQIISVLKGEGDQPTVTLRFIGGPDGRGRYLTVSNVPIFEEGDHDILFVADNGENQCPLINCNQGRFQILEEQVYDAEGFPLFLDEKGTMSRRGRPIKSLNERSLPPTIPENLREMREIQSLLLKHEFDDMGKELSEDSGRTTGEQPILGPEFGSRSDADTEDKTAGLSRLMLETFLDLLWEKVDRQRAGGFEPTQIHSVDVDEPFFIRIPKPVGPPPDAMEAKLPQPVPQTDQEIRELELLLQQGGDPVIRAQ